MSVWCVGDEEVEEDEQGSAGTWTRPLTPFSEVRLLRRISPTKERSEPCRFAAASWASVACMGEPGGRGGYGDMSGREA